MITTEVRESDQCPDAIVKNVELKLEVVRELPLVRNLQ